MITSSPISRITDYSEVGLLVRDSPILSRGPEAFMRWVLIWAWLETVDDLPLWPVCFPQPTPLCSVCRHKSGSTRNFRVARHPANSVWPIATHDHVSLIAEARYL